MPLIPNVLAAGLGNLDSDGGTSDYGTAATRLYDAWWGYAQGMVYLGAGAQAIGQGTAKTAFLSAMASAGSPSDSDAGFWNTFMGAMQAAWTTFGTGGLASPTMTLTPPSAPLYLMISNVLAQNMSSTSSDGCRQAIAGVLHGWTSTGVVIIPSAGGTPFA